MHIPFSRLQDMQNNMQNMQNSMQIHCRICRIICKQYAEYICRIQDMQNYAEYAKNMEQICRICKTICEANFRYWTLCCLQSCQEASYNRARKRPGRAPGLTVTPGTVIQTESLSDYHHASWELQTRIPLAIIMTCRRRRSCWPKNVYCYGGLGR